MKELKIKTDGNVIMIYENGELTDAKKATDAPTTAQTVADETDDIVSYKINPSLHFITPLEELTEAEKLFLKIGTGKENAVFCSGRDAYNRVSRQLKALVARANSEGAVIINDYDATGYYIPDRTRPEEMEAARTYIAKEAARAEKLNHKAAMMRLALM